MKKIFLSFFVSFLFVLPVIINAQETYINREATPDYKNEFEQNGVDGGLVGKALLIGRNTAGKRISQMVGGKHLPKNGATILFWVKPLDWDKNSPTGNRLFVDARGKGGQHFNINCFATRRGKNTFVVTNKQGTQEQHIRIPEIDWERNEWHQVAVSYDENSFRVYLDGVMKVEQKAPLFKNDFVHFFIGGDTGWDQGINGNSLIDEFQIFNTPLADDMIQHLYMKFAKDFPARSSIILKVNKRTPSLDGKVEAGEYVMGLTGTNALSNGKFSRLQSRYFLSHDDTYLYYAVQSRKASSFLAKVTQRDASIWEDDSVELHLINPEQKYFQFIFNSCGGIYDSAAEDRGWNADGLKLKNAVDGDIWTVEAAIPLKALGIAAVAADREWRINFGRAHLFERVNESVAPCLKRFAQKQLFAKMFLGDSDTAIDITSMGNLNSGKVNFSLTATSSREENITASLKTEDKRFPLDWSKRLASPKGSIAATGEQNITSNAVLNIEVTSDKDGVLYRNRIQTELPEPLVMNYIYTDLDSQILNFVCRRADDSPVSMKVTLFKRGTKEEVWNKTVSAPNKIGIVNVEFPIADMPSGRFDMTVEGLNADSKRIFLRNEYYFKPDGTPEWLKDRNTGVSHDVPAPWTRPVAAEDSWECWGRTYRFGGDAFISSIVTRNEELLAAPIRFRVNGTDTNQFTSKLQQTFADEASYLVSGKAGNLKVDADIVAEFDGFVKFDLTLTPEGPVDNVTLEIPLRGEMVDAFDNNQTFWVKTELPENVRGPIYANLADMPNFWIGNRHRGLIWGAKNIKGWYTKDLGKSLEITREGKVCLLKLRLADTTLPAGKARKITFYLNATPVKPLNTRYKNFHQGRDYHSGVSYWVKHYETHLDEYVNDRVLAGLQKRKNKFQEVFHYVTSHAASPRSAEWNYYCQDWHSPLPVLGDYADDAKGQDRDSLAKRDQHTYTYACLASNTFFWFKLNNMARMIEKCGLDNLYTDISWPKICSNPYHGCGWVDDFGRKQISFNIFETREFFKRIYRVLRSHKPDGVILQHLLGTTRTAAENFTDIFIFGEVYVHSVAGKESYYDIFKPTPLKIAYGYRSGEQAVKMIKEFSLSLATQRPDRYKQWSPDQPEAERAMKHFLAYLLVHDIEPYPEYWIPEKAAFRCTQVYDAEDWLSRDYANSHFYPYWDGYDKAPAVLAKVSDNTPNAIMMSSRRDGSRLLTSIVNDTDKEQKVTITFRDFKAFVAFNAFAKNTERYIIRNGKLELTLGPREGKILCISEN